MNIFLRIYLTSILSVLIGFVLAGVLSETGLIRFIGAKTSRIAKLGIHQALTPVPFLYLVSPRTAHANASAMLREGLIEPIDLYIAILASKLPSTIMHIYRFYIPVVLPLLGIVILYYIGLRILFDLLLAFTVLMIGRRRYERIRGVGGGVDGKVGIDFSGKTIKDGVWKGVRSSLSFISRFTPLFILVAFMLSTGISDKITSLISPILGGLGLDSLGITYITTAIFSPIAAYGVAKIMLNYYPVKELLGCMFLGTGLYLVLNECWTKILPFYCSLYPRNVSLKLLLLQAGLASIYNILLGYILIAY